MITITPQDAETIREAERAVSVLLSILASAEKPISQARLMAEMSESNVQAGVFIRLTKLARKLESKPLSPLRFAKGAGGETL